MNLILQERYGLQLEKPAPAWVEKYKLPHQLPVEEEINQYEGEIERLENELSAARQKLQDETRFRKLLYEHHDALEVIVRDALRELGAQVYDPQNPNREDGRIAEPVDNNNGLLEVKGLTGSLRQADVRQLDHWVREAMTEDWEGKGILIANTYCGMPLEQRGEPFPDNCVRLAERYGYCLLTTSQLFRAISSHQRDESDVESFWKTVFDAKGVCPLPELAAQI